MKWSVLQLTRTNFPNSERQMFDPLLVRGSVEGQENNSMPPQPSLSDVGFGPPRMRLQQSRTRTP